MSTQRIDLYRDDLRPQEPSEELPRNLALIGLAAFAMLAWGGIAQWRASDSAERLAALNTEQASLQAQMTTASEQLAARKPDAALTVALVEAQFGVDGRRWLVDELAHAGDEVVPFSSVLEGLGRQRPAPLWLTRIRVAEAGAELGLGGRTVDADAVPAFLQGLSTEDGLKDRDFTHFAIERPKDAGEPLQFDMATDCVALAAGCATKTEAEDAP
ncbi:hypothetical protein [Silanimonas sp.]|jgi:Tfp pilus assembly protein PilN|uniref:hypothetical protein n=1 Tax=Silanimonas sp. TaxID=1929290 RepID=UPI0022BB4902|nr:hypothetical protein [Silanimonas sp.]MCZ8113884.1 hypothetical protein [Silanimonas sp.]